MVHNSGDENGRITDVTIACIPAVDVQTKNVTVASKGKSSKSQVIYATLPAPNPFCTMTNATNSIDFVVYGSKGRATKTLALALQEEFYRTRPSPLQGTPTAAR